MLKGAATEPIRPIKASSVLAADDIVYRSPASSIVPRLRKPAALAADTDYGFHPNAPRNLAEKNARGEVRSCGVLVAEQMFVEAIIRPQTDRGVGNAQD